MEMRAGMEPVRAAWHSARANTYRMLADCFRDPEELDLARLPDLAQQVRHCAGPCAAAAEALVAAAPGGEPERESLRVSHARLFVGPFELLAPPYGSVYLDEGGRVMGDSTLAVIEHYAAAGLEGRRDAHEPPDHIATELEFMYYLAFRHVTTGDDRFLGRQAAFLADPLAVWVPRLCARIREADPAPFHTALADLLQAFIAADAAALAHPPHP